jgi:hypothetical protein
MKTGGLATKIRPVKNGEVATLHSTNAPDKTNHCGGARNYDTGNWQHEEVAWQIKKCAHRMRNGGVETNDEASQIKPWWCWD